MDVKGGGSGWSLIPGRGGRRRFPAFCDVFIRQVSCDLARTTIDINTRIDHVSILDEHGVVDAALEPRLADDVLLRMYRFMLAARRLDERMINLQRQGRIGTYGPSRGQEATQVATALALEPQDWTAQSFREMGMTLARGWKMHMPMFFWGGYEEGNYVPEEINDLPIAVPVASQLLHGVGIGWAMKIKGHDKVCIAYVGDGGTSEGDFHEAMNFAGVFMLPVVIVVQNNHFAISHPRRNQTRSRTLAQKAIAYGFEGVQVDGNDPLAVYAVTRQAVNKARSGGGPTLIECVTYRLSMHTTADDPTKYRDAAEVKQWEQRDPLIRFTKYLRDKGLLDDERIEQIETDIQEDIKAAIERYESYRADPTTAFDHILAELPPELCAQRAEYERALEQEGVLRNT